MINKFEGEYWFLSNFYVPAPVVYEGVRYPTTEHAYQAAKTLDVEKRKEIERASNPGWAKKLGRRVVVREDWEAIKCEVMLDLLRQKFEEPSLRAKLLATGDQELVEGNWWGDVYWGVCKGRGANHLGKLLMLLRAELRNAPHYVMLETGRTRCDQPNLSNKPRQG